MEREKEKIKIGEYEFREIESELLPDGRVSLQYSLGDARKTTAKLWIKKLTGVNVNKENGYAFEGEFVPAKTSSKYSYAGIIANEGDVFVAVKEWGSWKHPGQQLVMLVCRNGKMYECEIENWNNKADKIKAISKVAQIFNTLQQKKDEVKTYVIRVTEDVLHELRKLGLAYEIITP